MTNPVIDEAIKMANEVAKKIQEFFDTVNGVLEWVPGYLDHLIQPIIDGMNKIRQKVQEFWAELKDYFDNPGNPGKLEDFAERWRNAVGNPIGTVAGDVGLENMQTNLRWEGPAAEAYKAIVPPQGTGLNGIKTVSIDIATTLKDMANAIENFWIAFAFALASLVVAIIAAIVEACSVVAIPATIPTLLVGIGIALTAITFGVTELKGMYDMIDTKQDTIQQGLTDLGDEWKKSKTSMADPGDWAPA